MDNSTSVEVSADPARSKWVAEELELVQRHEQLLKRREALLRTTECYFDLRTGQRESFVTDPRTAANRNEMLLREMTESTIALKNKNKPSTKLNMLQNNYWVMVRRVFPVWSDELNDYEQRKNPNHVPSHSKSETTGARAQSSSPRGIGIESPRSRDTSLLTVPQSSSRVSRGAMAQTSPQTTGDSRFKPTGKQSKSSKAASNQSIDSSKNKNKGAKNTSDKTRSISASQVETTKDGRR